MIVEKRTSKLAFTGHIIKPDFEFVSTSTVQIPGSTSKPFYLVIGQRPFKIESTLQCNFNVSGLGGLARGGTVSASSVYYLYAVLDEETVGLVMDTNGPSSGPFGYPQWTYIGSFAVSSVSIIPNFVSSNGRVIFDDEISSASHTGDTNISTETLALVPETAKFYWVLASINGTSVDTVGRVMGFSNDTGANPVIVRLQVSTVTNYSIGAVPVETAGTVYLRVDNSANTVVAFLLGWIENPSLYP